MATIKDVAELAGVNISTVSRTLGGTYPVSPATRQRVMEAVEQLGYHPNPLAKGLKSSRTMMLALLVPALDTSVFSAVATHVEAAARQLGYTVIICNTDEDDSLEREYIAKLQGSTVDGFLCATATEDKSHLRQLGEQVPLVLVVRKLKGLPSVTVDDYAGAKEATQYLVSRGCRRIALFNGPPGINVFRDRERGFRHALLEAGITAEPAVFRDSEERASVEYAWRSADKLLDMAGDTDAVFAVTDTRAAAVINMAKRRGIAVPGRLRVFGFGDLEIARVTDPAITTMTQPLQDICRRAVQRLVAQIEGEAPTGAVEEFKATLRVRESA